MKKILFILLLIIPFFINGQPLRSLMAFMSQEESIPTLFTDAIAWYDFEETSGTVLVDEKDTHNGTIGTSGVTINQSGNPGQSHDFQSGFDTVPDNDAFTFGNRFAISAWVNFDAVGSTNGITGKNREWELFLYSTQRFAMRFYDSGGTTYFQLYTDEDSYTTGTDYHVVFNITDYATEHTGYEIWVNGVEKDHSTNNDPVTMSNTSNDVRVGHNASYWSPTYTDGPSSQLVFYGDSLSPLRIDSLYNSGAGVLYNGY